MSRAGWAGGLALAAAAVLAPPASAKPPPRQVLAALQSPHTVRAVPDVTAAVLGRVVSHRPLAGARTTLPVLGRRVDGAGRQWLLVRLPGRRLTGRTPARTGWIKAFGTRRFSTAWRLVVHLGTRQVQVVREGRTVRRFAAIVGAPSTPTPLGAAFVEENLRLPAARAGAPFALALSARSGVLQEFDGGPGQIALHGRSGLGGRLGTAVSHGCIRLDDTAIAWLAARIRPGVPVVVAP